MAAVASPLLIALVGPTAAGKSALALRLAEEQGGEIVSCDSLQVYRGLDIGSAKPSPEERRRVPHHLLDVVDPDQEFSAAAFARLARAAIREIVSRGALPLVVGGSGLYFRSLFRGLFAGPSRDPVLRKRLERLADRFGDSRLHRLVERVDPEAARRIQVRDRVRAIRALEVFRQTGLPISAHHKLRGEALEGYETLLVGLRPKRLILRACVERRARQMFARGLLLEVQGLLDRGYAPGLKPLRAIGYRQAQEVLIGERGEEDAIARITADTMRYAKRQMTWFRREAGVVWAENPGEVYATVSEWLAKPAGDT